MSVGNALTGFMRGLYSNGDPLERWKKLDIERQVRDAMQPTSVASGKSYNGAQWVSDQAAQQQAMLDEQERGVTGNDGMRRFVSGNSRYGYTLHDTETEAQAAADKYNSIPAMMARVAPMYTKLDPMRGLQMMASAQTLQRSEDEFARKEALRKQIEALDAEYKPIIEAGYKGMHQYAPKFIGDYNSNTGIYADGNTATLASGLGGNLMITQMGPDGKVIGTHSMTPKDYMDKVLESYRMRRAILDGTMPAFAEKQQEFGLKRDTLTETANYHAGALSAEEAKLRHEHDKFNRLLKAGYYNRTPAGGGGRPENFNETAWANAEARAQEEAARYTDAQIAAGNGGMSRMEWINHRTRYIYNGTPMPARKPLSTAGMFGTQTSAQPGVTPTAPARKPTYSDVMPPELVQELFRQYGTKGLTSSNFEQWVANNHDIVNPMWGKYITE